MLLLKIPLLTAQEIALSCGQITSSARLGLPHSGAIGKRSEAVGAEAAASLISAMGSAGADVRLSDQLLIYMSLARGVSIIKTSAITEHMRNNALLISQFTGKAFEIDEKSNIIKVDGIGVVRR